MNDLRAIEQTAAEWAGRISAGLTPAAERELEAWVGRDLRHAEALARMEGVSRALDQFSSLHPAGSIDTDPDFAGLNRRRTWSPWFAAAAAIAILLSVFAVQRFTASDPSALATTVGEFRTKQLPDGSVVALNTDTELRLRYTPTERRIEFTRGEARFTVAKDPSRPFNVAVGGVTVQAVGTVFNVRLRSDTLEVLVTEGRVKLDHVQGRSLPQGNDDHPSTAAGVSDAPSPVDAAGSALQSFSPTALLSAGQRATIPVALESTRVVPTATASIVPLSEAHIAKALAWEHRRLVFDPTPLADIVAEFNRYNEHKLVIADPTLSTLLVGGTFDTDDYAALTRLLETGFGVAAERSPDQTVLRRR